MSLNLRPISKILFIITFWIGGSVLCFSSTDGEVHTSITPFFNFVITQDKSNIESGFELKMKNEFLVRIVGRVPLIEDSKPQFSQIDRHTNTWRIGLSIFKEWYLHPKINPLSSIRLGFEGYWGHSKFKYFPNGGEVEESENHHSFSAGVNLVWFYQPNKPNSYQIAPQLRVHYTRDWEASEKIGIVIPGEEDSPSTVIDKIIAPPKAIPNLSIRLAVPCYFGTEFPIAFGPSVGLVTTGSDRDWSPEGVTTRSRFEFWIYWFPVIKKPTNVRLGLAPFLDSRIGGDDKLDKNIYGVLLQLRIGITLLEY